MSMCLAPTMYGAGINGKIGEALAFGIPVVTTPLGALAYGLEHRKTAMIAKDSKEFIDSINELIISSTIIAFDEYYNYDKENEGWKEHEYKAFQEYVEKYNRKFEYIARTNREQVVVKIVR